MKVQEDIKVQQSNGFTKSGRSAYYIRPVAECANRSRRCVGWERINATIERWYAPMVILYSINGSIIGSNSKANALKEYWRKCALPDVGKEFEVHQLTPQDKKQENEPTNH